MKALPSLCLALTGLSLVPTASVVAQSAPLESYSTQVLLKEVGLRRREDLLGALKFESGDKELKINGKSLKIPMGPLHGGLNNAMMSHASTAQIYDESLAPGEKPSEVLKGIPTEKLTDELVTRTKTITGPDDRKDVYMVRQTAQQQQQLGVAQPREEKYLEKAKSVGCLVYDSDLVKLPTGDYILRTQPYKEAFVLCGAERFNEQPIVSFCTAFLTAPAEVTTAGHCVPFTVGELERLRLVFGFHLDSATLPGHFLIKATDVYSIRQVKGRFDSPNAADWAVLKLDRPCPDRPPLELGDGKPAPGAGVYTIGHPCGLPLKIAD
ncbi:MAG TPA: trypsin-like serine protease, partial [Verrucomicrobium sp.]|nr:trypsin-like serine protease [Verrucomicrobium sp.]